ncbi:sphingosine kinase 2-like isoform X1 [Cynara cardunculus var. scolymus]|uniref:sphingosine kinase 2-like isoform X1 n=2 Tax=Cynara cardunculus var. scolymus TaxID=59895 RepID=UPI000D629EF7|nr:sphingosine kinase 2-like isoform X1 [Cynara cardunculus var. scolymus]
MDQQHILCDEVLVNGGKTGLTLSTDGILRWYDHGNVLQCLSVEKEVLGVSMVGQQIEIRSFVEIDSGGFCFGCSRRSLVRKSFNFEPLSEDSLRNLCEKIQGYIDSLGRPKKLFIFVNPFGGRKSAFKVFTDDVKPILEDANIEYKLQETKYQLHAKEVSHTLDLTKYDGIICVSGDGILVEVVNGLLEREDWQAALKMAIGVIPAGTGNGMIKSLLDSVGQPCTAAYAMLAAIRGHKRSLDVATIWQGDTRFYSVLMLAWGLIADIDIESEQYRWMGSARMDFYGLQRILRLRRYNGCISFVPAPGFEDVGEPSSLGVESMEPLKARQHGYEGPNVELGSLSWRKLNGPFVSIWLHNVPWGAENTMAAPNAKFDDGYLDLIVMRECPKMALISLMSGLSNGHYVRSPHVLYIKVKAVILEPGSRTIDSTKEGIIDSDGEVLARGNGTYRCHLKSLMVYGKMQIVVDRGLATLFTPI